MSRPVSSLAKKAGFLALAVTALSLEATTADDISGLLNNSPFGGPATGNSATPAQTQLELRGIVVEGGVAWFTFFDSASNKWVTLRQGEEADALVVKRYDRVQDLVELDYKGRTLSLALKSAGNQSYRETPAAYAATSAPTKAPVPQPVIIPPLSAAEAKRLELVASVLKQRREASKQGTPSPGQKGS